MICPVLLKYPDEFILNTKVVRNRSTTPDTQPTRVSDVHDTSGLILPPSVSGDWYPGRLTQAKATFQDKDGPIGLLLGRAGQTYGRLPQANSRTDCQQSAQAQSAHPSNTKTIIRLVSSWAEMSAGMADCPWQSTLSRANCRPRRSRHTSSS